MIESKHSISDLNPASLPDVQLGRRLVVLVPRLDINLPAFAHRVWELANATGSHILLLGQFDEAQQESQLRRDLATLSAMLADEKITVESKISFGKDWSHLVKTNLQKADMLVHLAEHRIKFSQSEIDAQIYILSGLVPKKDSSSNWFSQLTSILGSLAIIIGFFMLQVRIIDLTKSWLQTLLLFISVPVGLWAIWAWNSLFG